jgi:uncharacterized membrane protein YhaH (DUF805 family)
MNPETELPAAAKSRTLDRWPYFWWGCALMAFKYNLDRLIAWQGFHRSWYFWNYIKPSGFASIDALPPDDERFYFILLLTSLPFLLAGIFLTLRRLRSAGLPLGFCLLFFVPVINLVFFALLCLVPARTSAEPRPGKPGWLSWLPTSAAGSALAGTVLVGLVGVGLAYLSTAILQNYGWGLFVALPFAMGLVSVLIYAGPQNRSFGSCLLVAMLPIAFAGLCIFTLAMEGLVCLIMAAPIALVLSLMGGVVGYLIAGNHSAPVRPAAMLVVLVSVPFTMGMEKQADEPPPLLKVTSSVVIDAPPDQVWPNVVSFSSIPPARDWVLHTGVAYPTRARIDGHGVGAVRHCIFTTGEFVEPIEVWDENRLLRFSVAQQPEPMEEMSPYPHLKTTHLDGYFLSREGELRLIPLSGGRTLLEGTTWYTDRIWPSAYWQLWSDLLIHHIHLRVLHHIKNLSERTSEKAP